MKNLLIFKLIIFSLIFSSCEEEEMAQNQVMWSEEKGESRDDAAKGADLRDVGVTGGGIDTDIAGETQPAPDDIEGDELDAGEEGDLVAPDEGDE